MMGFWQIDDNEALSFTSVGFRGARVGYQLQGAVHGGVLGNL